MRKVVIEKDFYIDMHKVSAMWVRRDDENEIKEIILVIEGQGVFIYRDGFHNITKLWVGLKNEWIANH